MDKNNQPPIDKTSEDLDKHFADDQQVLQGPTDGAPSVDEVFDETIKPFFGSDETNQGASNVIQVSFGNVLGQGETTHGEPTQPHTIASESTKRGGLLEKLKSEEFWGNPKVARYLGYIGLGLAATGLAIGGKAALDGMAKADQERDKSHVNDVVEVLDTGKVPDGKLAFTVDTGGGTKNVTVWDKTNEIASDNAGSGTEERAKLRSAMETLTGVQGYPGLQSTDVILANKDAVDPNEVNVLSGEELEEIAERGNPLNDHGREILKGK